MKKLIFILAVVLVLLGIAGYYIVSYRSGGKEVLENRIAKECSKGGKVITEECANLLEECRTKYPDSLECPTGENRVNQVNRVMSSPSFPSKLDAGSPAPPADQALVEITVLSRANGKWKIRVDKIYDYIRYPAATNSQLKIGDAIVMYFNGWLDTFQSSDEICPTGYTKSPNPGQDGSATQLSSAKPPPQITTGQQYLSKLEGCFSQINCPSIGWSGVFYSPSATVIEYECVKLDTTTSPATNPQDGFPTVRP